MNRVIRHSNICQSLRNTRDDGCWYCVWNVKAHAQKPDFVFRRNGRVHLNRRGRQFSRLLAAEVCASAVVMLDTPRSEVVWEYWLPTPFASFPFTSPLESHRVPSGFKRTLRHRLTSRKSTALACNLKTDCVFLSVLVTTQLSFGVRTGFCTALKYVKALCVQILGKWPTWRAILYHVFVIQQMT